MQATWAIKNTVTTDKFDEVLESDSLDVGSILSYTSTSVYFEAFSASMKSSSVVFVFSVSIL